jgi:carbohydrate esterase-like sialic acid-specific acetylesterase
MKIIKAAIAFAMLALCVASSAGQFGYSSIDPFIIKELVVNDTNLWNFNRGYTDTNAKTLRTTGIAINPAKKTLILFSGGQSNSGNINPSAYVPTNASVIDNFNIYDGAFYAPACPVLGTAWGVSNGPGHVGLRVADALISAGKFDRVILVPVGVGSGASASFAPGGQVDDRFRVAIKRLAARGITPSSIGTTWAITWMQGESDNLAGVSQAGYSANMAAVIAQSYTDGFVGRWFIAEETMAGNVVSSAVQAAQISLVDGVNVFSAGNIDSLTTATNRQADGTHLNDTGAASAATLIVNAMHASGAPY